MQCPKCDTEIPAITDPAILAAENARLVRELAQVRLQLEARTSELRESIQQQTATANVLKVISRSRFELQAVFDALAESAARLCDGQFCFLLRFDGKLLHFAACHGLTSEGLKAFQRELPRPAGDDTVSGRAILHCAISQIPDVKADPAYGPLALAQDVTYRSIVAVPLLRDGRPVGAIAVGRPQVGSFSEGQVRLLEIFAEQAVIAIENTRLFEEVQARTRELQESLEYQTATSDVLSVISRSPNKLQPVLDEIASTAGRLCDGYDTVILLKQGDQLRIAAHHGPMPIDFEKAPIDRGWVAGRTVVDCKPIHVWDLSTAGDEFPLGQGFALRLGHRTSLGIPLLRDGEAIGCLFLRRTKVQPFTEKQIALLETFADQAVIAINNVRLFEEVQTRTKELAESLKHQTATADVLGVISRSAFDLQPVFETVAESAVRLCEAERAFIFRFDGELLRVAAVYNVSDEFKSWVEQNPIRPGRHSGTARAALERRTTHIPDVLADPEYTYGAKEVAPIRTLLGVPILKGDDLLGVVMIFRLEVRPFTNKQIALVETFADQAAIAIENARLFEEVQQKNHALTAANGQLSDALEHQTATAEILRVISSSPTDLQPVYDAIVKSAVKLCGAIMSCVFRFDGELIHLVAEHNFSPDGADVYRQAYPLLPADDKLIGAALLERRPVNVADVLEKYRVPIGQSELGHRSVVAVPMLRDGIAIGVIAAARRDPGLFPQTQVELLQTFADQAVIAIENGRLFEEVQCRTRELARSVAELKALSEISQAVNASLDLERVLSTILAHACQMSDSGGGAIYVFDDLKDEYVLEAGHNMSWELVGAVRAQHLRRGTPLVGECVERCATVEVPDLALAGDYPLFEVLRRGGIKALLAVPLLHREKAIGALLVRRKSSGAFAPETVRLLQNFAAQSSLAIYNARLFREIEQKSRQLEIASRHKSQFVANMSHELRTPLAAMLGYAELLKEGIYGVLPERATPIVTRIQSNGKHLLGLINTVLDISKIEAGQFKLNITEYALGNVIETVRIATESLAAGKKLALETNVAKYLPQGLGDEQRLTQVLLNLVGNAIKFTDTGKVRITAAAADGHFALSVSDTGPGIPPEERDRIFEKFHQIDASSTRTKGGTGLGLAIAKQIVEMHGGRIWVESALGHGSTFRMELPVRVTGAAGAA
jgi:GAF domain-containing protein